MFKSYIFWPIRITSKYYFVRRRNSTIIGKKMVHGLTTCKLTKPTKVFTSSFRTKKWDRYQRLPLCWIIELSWTVAPPFSCSVIFRISVKWFLISCFFLSRVYRFNLAWNIGSSFRTCQATTYSSQPKFRAGYDVEIQPTRAGLKMTIFDVNLKNTINPCR